MNNVPEEFGSISRAIAACGHHDERAANQIWNRFFERLCHYVRSYIFDRHRRHFDEEDIANSALFALFDGLKNSRFASVKRRNELWQLLTVIAARKACNTRKHFDCKKRGSGKVRGESVLSRDGLNGIIDYVQSTSRDSDYASFEMLCRDMIQRLPDERLRKVALRRLAGCSVDQIAEEFNCVRRTIERKLALIRRIWSKEPIV